MENESKMRLIMIYKILYHKTDEEHTLSTNALIRELFERHGISAHRVTVARDIEVLKECGADICVIESTQNKYYMPTRAFELPELKMLIDAVCASRIISTRKSLVLVDKLCKLSSEYNAPLLQKGSSVFCYDKPNNERIFYIIDAIGRAINTEQKITFRYYEYLVSGHSVLRNDGEPYLFSPYALHWNGDYYYTVGYSDKHKKVISFRIDRIADVPVLLGQAAPKPKNFSVNDYVKTAFRMFGGEVKRVTVSFENSLVSCVADKFGYEIELLPVDETHSMTTAEVALSPIFFRWIFGFAGKIRIEAPYAVKAQYAQLVKEAYQIVIEEERLSIG